MVVCEPAQFLPLKGTVRSGMQGALSQYARPRVVDYGDLRTITAAFHPVMGADLGFSAPNNQPGAPGGPGGAGGTGGAGGDPPQVTFNPPGGGGDPQVPGGSVTGPVGDGGVGDGGGSDPGGDPGGGDVGSGGAGGGSGGGSGGSGSGGSGSGGGGSGGGGELPFTGLAAGIVAGVGGALTAGGTALRRLANRRR